MKTEKNNPSLTKVKRRRYGPSHRKLLEYLESMGVPMATAKGSIRCNKCHKSMDGDVCACGCSNCYISLYWRGKQHRFFNYSLDGMPFNLNRAKAQLSQINHAILKNKFNPRDWDTLSLKERKFEHQAHKWLEQKKTEVENIERAYETWRTYRSYVNNHFLEFKSFKGWDVREIRYEQIEGFKDWLGKRVSINTRKRIIGALHAFFKWMQRKGVIKELPLFPIMESEDVVKNAITYESQMELLTRLPESHRDIFEFGYETGLRPNELCAIQVGDIDTINDRALIRRGYSGVMLQEKTKGKNKKWIPLSSRAFEIAFKNTKDKLPAAFLFTNKITGQGYKLKTLDNIWAKHTNRAITFYEASRHSFCTQIAESGANLLQAKELMRHKDIRSTEKYFHATTDRLRDIVNRRGRAVLIERPLNEQVSAINQ